MRNYAKLIQEFYVYCWQFYNLDTGIYKIATAKRIQEAVNEYLASKPLSQIEFDSIDRELVRKIIEPDYALFIP